MNKLLLALLLLSTSCSSFSPRQSDSVYALVGFFGGGTGFLVKAPSGKDYILTNAHVCEIARVLQTDRWSTALDLIQVSDHTDLCLLEAPQGLGQAIELANQEPKAHEQIHIIGQGLLLGNTLTEGHWVGHIGPTLRVMSPAYCTATVLPGNSGSPVLDDAGRLVGVVFASGPILDNRGLLVPLSDIKEFLKDR